MWLQNIYSCFRWYKNHDNRLRNTRDTVANSGTFFRTRCILYCKLIAGVIVNLSFLSFNVLTNRKCSLKTIVHFSFLCVRVFKIISFNHIRTGKRNCRLYFPGCNQYFREISGKFLKISSKLNFRKMNQPSPDFKLFDRFTAGIVFGIFGAVIVAIAAVVIWKK